MVLHYTQSFSPDEPITGQQAHELAKEFAEKAWPESQVLVATHVDVRHIHSHFIVNAVCHESGYMLRQGPTTLKRLRKLSDEICQAHGLSILQPNPPRHMVSSLLHHGVDKQTVAELAGHADTSFLERTYCHPQMELKRQAANVMTDILLHSA